MGDSDVRALNQLRERTLQAENAGDARFFEGVSAEDVIVMPPGMPAVSGRAATVAFMSAFLGQFDLRIQYVSEEVQVHGDLGSIVAHTLRRSPLRAEARGTVSLGITYGFIRGGLTEGGSSHALCGTPASRRSPYQTRSNAAIKPIALGLPHVRRGSSRTLGGQVARLDITQGDSFHRGAVDRLLRASRWVMRSASRPRCYRAKTSSVGIRRALPVSKARRATSFLDTKAI